MISCYPLNLSCSSLAEPALKVLPSYLQMLASLRHYWTTTGESQVGLSQFLEAAIQSAKDLARQRSDEGRYDRLLEELDGHREKLLACRVEATPEVRAALEPVEAVLGRAVSAYLKTIDALLEFLLTEESQYLEEATQLNALAFGSMVEARVVITLAGEQLLDYKRGVPLYQAPEKQEAPPQPPANSNSWHQPSRPTWAKAKRIGDIVGRSRPGAKRLLKAR